MTTSDAADVRGLPERLEVVTRIGQGGMATVYLGRDHVSHSEVALKVLLPHLREDELIVERFRREIAAVRRIVHPNVVSIFELIENDQVLCLVQEYFPGSDLKRLVRLEERLSPQRLVTISGQVLDALQAAHEEGIIHRDIKPHNVLVGSDDTVRVVDFGLARVDDMVGLTTHTMSVGTPEYMAPELMMSTLVDGRADLYALGVTMFEALTGRLPYQAPTPLALMKKHQEEQAPDPREFAPDAPEFLCDVINRALQTEPEDRFSTADEMREALTSRAVRPLAEPSGDLCVNCGAELVTGLPSCIECGHEVVVIAEEPGSGAVVAIPRRHFAFSEEGLDYLTYEDKSRLIDTLEQLGGIPRVSVEQLDRELKRFPVAVASNLTNEDATYIGHRLEELDIPVKVYPNDWWGKLRSLVQFQEPLVWMKRGLFITIFGGGALIGWLIIERIWWALGLMATIFFVWWIGRYIRRKRPLVRFLGDPGYALIEDEMTRRAAEVFARVETVRIRNLLRRILQRGINLRERIEEDDWAPAGMLDELDRTLLWALHVADRVATLEENAEIGDPRQIHERIAGVEERLQQTENTHDAGDLIEEKVRLKSLLQDFDDRQREVTRLSSQLLDICSELEKIESRLHELDKADYESLSVVLRNLTTQMDAKEEIETQVAPQLAVEHT